MYLIETATILSARFGDLSVKIFHEGFTYKILFTIPFRIEQNQLILTASTIRLNCIKSESGFKIT